MYPNPSQGTGRTLHALHKLFLYSDSCFHASSLSFSYFGLCSFHTCFFLNFARFCCAYIWICRLAVRKLYRWLPPQGIWTSPYRHRCVCANQRVSDIIGFTSTVSLPAGSGGSTMTVPYQLPMGFPLFYHVSMGLKYHKVHPHSFSSCRFGWVNNDRPLPASGGLPCVQSCFSELVLIAICCNYRE